MATFHQVRVKNLYKETKDCTVLTFDIPNDLAVAFHFRQGQHLTLRAFIDGEDVRRSYSLCTSPFENTWRWRLNKFPEGSSHLRQSKP